MPYTIRSISINHMALILNNILSNLNLIYISGSEIYSLNIDIFKSLPSGTFPENNEDYLSEVHRNTGIETNGALKTITLFDTIIFAAENNAEKSRRNRKVGRGVCSFKRGQCERDSSACRCHSGSIHSFRSRFH